MKNIDYKRTGLFFGLSTIIPWGCWFIAADISYRYQNTNLTSIIAFLGMVSPVFVIACFVKANRSLRNDLLSRLFNFKGISPFYFLFTVGFMLLSILLAQFVSLFFGYSAEQFRLAKHFSFNSGVFPVWLLLIVAPLIEELAWHSYGTDSLRLRFNLFNTSIIFALFWGIWHIPLSLIKDYYHSNLVAEGWIYSVNFIVSLIPFVLIINWIYYKTNRNIILPIVFHVTAGLFNEIFATHPMSKVIQTGLLLLFSGCLIIADKDFFFTKTYCVQKVAKSVKTSRNNFLYKIIGAFLVLLLAGNVTNLYSQNLTQNIQGVVYDEVTREPIPFASIALIDTGIVRGTVSGIDGSFILENIEVGRRNIMVNMVGYQAYEINELLVSTGKPISLNIGMQKAYTHLDEVVVRIRKETALNSMTTLSSRQFTVEETQRYAGGMDDPARLVSSFAGVATPSISSNGISVRGNNPDGLLWRIDGVEVPAPCHFANLTVSGGGLLSVISSQMMSNSDFYTGAFPAEYGNALSGVFDINLKTGNTCENHYTFTAGVLGVGASAEGPFSKKSNASYTINYRNSSMALIAPLLPDDAGVLKYQDLAFKTNLPTKKIGTFSFWGIGAYDGVDVEATDSSEWESNSDRDNSQTSMYMYASALSHKINLGSGMFLNTTVSTSGTGLDHQEQRLNEDLTVNPQSSAENNTRQYTFQTNITKCFSEKHTNKTGVNYSYMQYSVDVEQSLSEGTLPTQLAYQEGSTGLFQAFSQSKFRLGERITLNAGLNAMLLTLNNNYSIEPRLGLKYNIDSRNSIALGYGIHSRMEQLPVYFVTENGSNPNKDLELMKSTHYIFAYNTKLSKNVRLSIEPYYQYLRDVPVSPSGYASTLNNVNILFYDEVLVSKGTGRNIGVDITLEKFLSKGYYYMFTASIFDSKYTDANGVERNTRFNKNYIFNVLCGKEWQLKQNKILSANFRLNYLGGNRIETIDIDATMASKEIVYGETNGEIAFSEQFKGVPIASFTLSYRKNKTKYSSVWAVQVLNATYAEEYDRDVYNLKTDAIETQYDGTMIPNISYTIEF